MPLHRTIEHDRHVRAVTADQRAVALDDAPIDRGVLVTIQILHRNAIELGAADIGADGIDQPVPAAARIEQCRSRDVVFAFCARSTRVKECADRFWKSSCSARGKPTSSGGRIQGGGVLSIATPCSSATRRHGLRSAECSQPQPRSSVKPDRRSRSRPGRRAAAAPRQGDSDRGLAKPPALPQRRPRRRR